MKRRIALFLAVLMALSACGSLCGCQALPQPGRVYYINCMPDAHEAWQRLAATYSDLNGVEVTVRTVTTEDHLNELLAVLDQENAPTAFQIQSAQEFESLRKYCMDMTGTAVLGQMTTGAFNLADTNGAVRAIGYTYEAFGLVVNKELLDRAGYSMEDIRDFETLKAVAEDIHGRAEQLGFDAFAYPDLTDQTSWRFTRDLADVPLYYELRDLGALDREADVSGTYLNQYRQIWDLYLNCSTPKKSERQLTVLDESLREMAEGKVAFCQHRASVYHDLVGASYGMTPKQIGMIPIYCGVEGEENAALGSYDRGYWAVNDQSSEADKKATLDFLNWVVTSEIGINTLQQFGGVPFKAAGKSANGFFSDANALIMAGKYPLTGYGAYNEQWETDLAAALTIYAAEQTDENWEQVMTSFVKDKAA